MKGLPFVLLFTAMTFVAWGAYGPVLHHGAVALDHDRMRAFVGVGLAYFLIAVIFPAAMLKTSGESGKWTVTGALYSLVAGAVGAVGALGIIFALGYGGEALFVMPLVFGFAPVVNTLVTALLGRTFGQISPLFIAGIVAAALGAGGVLYFKASPKAASTEHAVESIASTEGAVDGDDSAKTEAEDENADEHAEAKKEKTANWPGIIASIIVAALCWGSYGPMLHIGQAKMQGSRMRPFACVGIAYFLIAVVAPLVVIYSRSPLTGSWDAMGMWWSFLAGVAGAIGALGVILAFNAGGKPYYVMPLIFGFAPVVNTFISLTQKDAWGQVHPLFWLSLGVVIAGAVTVLINAPKPRKPAAPPAPDAASEPAAS